MSRELKPAATNCTCGPFPTVAETEACELAMRAAEASPNAPEPAPLPGAARPTWELVVEDMLERDRIGATKYGIRHQHDNGRDHLIDAYQECLDQALYLRAEIEKRRQQLVHLDEAIARSEAKR